MLDSRQSRRIFEGIDTKLRLSLNRRTGLIKGLERCKLAHGNCALVTTRQNLNAEGAVDDARRMGKKGMEKTSPQTDTALMQQLLQRGLRHKTLLRDSRVLTFPKFWRNPCQLGRGNGRSDRVSSIGHFQDADLGRMELDSEPAPA
ncbi:hypothetical protein FZEAL_5685 [Fusarium zealandicum]|uniref:Uncharacterized protein n=1 Tax=Fusarium zealandicum TaxID=1053134 RepID=A0A8H4UJ62_9HYPO|nr:hypothetical protein FZEAL_5685 [Fusarium zealandicum]